MFGDEIRLTVTLIIVTYLFFVPRNTGKNLYFCFKRIQRSLHKFKNKLICCLGMKRRDSEL